MYFMRRGEDDESDNANGDEGLWVLNLQWLIS